MEALSLRLPKKLSMAALSKQFLFLDILCVICCTPVPLGTVACSNAGPAE
jgi:hypothetical protein